MQSTCVYCFRFVSVRNLLLNFLQSSVLSDFTRLNFQGCIAVYLSRFMTFRSSSVRSVPAALLWAATVISYHHAFHMSTAFFTFFVSFFMQCFSAPKKPRRFSRWSFIITLIYPFVNIVFQNFLIKFLRSFSLTFYSFFHCIKVIKR